ncbi:MAG: helix-turn-helix domain-containing protein [Defluviitaleaceae bacterium]|nr:helix-turn-helix domain-containing protein [Defluviitaleaceae bacterium]
MLKIQSPTLTAKQAATYIGVSYWTLLGLARQGRIKHFRGGNKILFRKTSLDTWIDEAEAASIKKAE